MTRQNAEHGGEVDAVARVLLEHRDSGVTAVYSGCGDDERITGARAWCHCGGAHWEGGRLPDPSWRGTFNAPGDQAERELRNHIAEAVVAALRVTPSAPTHADEGGAK